MISPLLPDPVSEALPATALFYRIRSDTLDLGRRATEADLKATVALSPHVNLKTIAAIIDPNLSRQ